MHNPAEVLCPAATPPQHGYLHEGNPDTRFYHGGDVVQFGCNPGYMMQGNPIIVCQENRRWSGPPPVCIPACTYPGTTSGGTIR